MYDKAQQIFTLSLFSNFANYKVGECKELEKDFTQVLDDLLSSTAITALIGDWQVVWGPSIYQEPHHLVPVADNAMYVAKNENKTYVVAIAGTNPYSMHGIFTEDLKVKEQKPWRGDPALGLVASGTRSAISALTKLDSGTGDSTYSISEFLKREEIENLVVTGHSLGGTLAPVMATWLAEEQKITPWSSTPRIETYASAGASPGDSTFAATIEGVLGKEFIFRIWNLMDVVPHAWVESLLSEVKDLYEPNIKPDLLVKALVDLAIDAAKGRDYTHPDSDAKPLQGTYYPVEGKNDFDKYLSEMDYQHVDAYIQLMGMEDLLPLVRKYVDALRKNAKGHSDTRTKVQARA